MNELKNLSLSNILSCLALIEQHIARRPAFFDYVVNSIFNPYDVVSLQKEARSMMDFVGLQNYTALITYERTKEGIAGSINLNEEKIVYIEIDKLILNRNKSRETILGVLAHEICHKLLFTHGLYMSDTITNEICTELTTIYVGFGLLTILGCSSEETRIQDGQTTKQIFSTGYLTPKSYILAYIMMARSYGIKLRNLRFNFDTQILRRAYLSAVFEARKFRQYNKEQVKEQLICNSKNIAQIKRYIIYLRTILDDLEKNLAEDYKHIDNQTNRLITGNIDKYPIGAMYSMSFASNKNKKRSLRNNLKKIVDDLIVESHSSDKVLDEKLRYVVCPICGQIGQKPLDENSISIRRCKCGRIFVWNAEPYSEMDYSFLGRIKRFW